MLLFGLVFVLFHIRLSGSSSKSSIKDLFKDLFNEIKGFKCQITVKVLLSKRKENSDIEFVPVYFNSTTKTVVNSDEYKLDASF